MLYNYTEAGRDKRPASFCFTSIDFINPLRTYHNLGRRMLRQNISHN